MENTRDSRGLEVVIVVAVVVALILLAYWMGHQSGRVLRGGDDTPTLVYTLSSSYDARGGTCYEFQGPRGKSDYIQLHVSDKYPKPESTVTIEELYMYFPFSDPETFSFYCYELPLEDISSRWRTRKYLELLLIKIRST